jgi:hypothetical protein
VRQTGTGTGGPRRCRNRHEDERQIHDTAVAAAVQTGGTKSISARGASQAAVGGSIATARRTSLGLPSLSDVG